MNGVTRLGDAIVPHCVAAPTIEASGFLRADGIGVSRDGDAVDTHITPPCPLPGPPHTPPIAVPGGRYLRADGRRVATITDPVSGCTTLDEGSAFMRAS